MSQAPSWFEWLFRPEATDARRTGPGDAASMVRKTRRLQRRMRTLTADNDALALQIAQKTATNTHLAATNERLTAQLADANATLDATNARLDTTNAQSDTRLQEVVSENADLVATNARLDTANAQSDARLQEVVAENARLDARWSDVGSLTDTLSLWARNLSDEDIHHLEPLEGEDVQYLIDDVSKYKTLAVSSQRVVATHDTDVHTFSDANYTYIIMPYLHQNVRQILSITCDSTIIQLRYHLSPHLAWVQILDQSTDGTQVIVMNGRNLFTTGSHSHWKLQVSSGSRQLSTVLSLTWLDAGDVSSLSLEASTAVVVENPSSGTKLAVRTAASMLDRSDSYVFQLVHGVDSALSSNQMSVDFVSNIPTFID